MGRLFWKLFLAFLLAFFAIGLISSLAFWTAHKTGPAHLQDLAPSQLHLLTGAEAQPATRSSKIFLNELLVGIVLTINLGLSSLLAWYLTQPIRVLREAFHAIANGHLDTRVAHLIGRRRDDIADLGRDFDRMAEQFQLLIGVQQRLLHDVSHELRSPLARLQAAVGLAHQDPRKIYSTLERVENESRRLETMLEEVLTLARLEASAQPFELERTDLIALIGNVVDSAQFEADAQGRDIRFTSNGPAHALVRSDMIYRAFENVIRNAIKYTTAGSEVLVDAKRLDRQLQVVVLDRGPGVEEGSVEAIFEPFFRLANNPQMKGFGLGLAIARRAIVSHDGSISAANREGGGLMVTIILPCLAPD